MRPEGRPRACAALVSLVLALAGAGCGGSSNTAANRYVDQVNQAQREFATNVQGLSAATAAAGSTPARRAALGRFQGALSTIVGRFQAIRPPQKVAALHSQLIDEVRGFGDAVGTAVSSLNAPDINARRAASAALLARTSTVGTRISGTIDAINRRLHG